MSCAIEMKKNGKMDEEHPHTCWERLEYTDLYWVNQSCDIFSFWLIYHNCLQVKVLSMRNKRVRFLSRELTTLRKVSALLTRLVG